jgi:hypothetical protein
MGRATPRFIFLTDRSQRSVQRDAGSAPDLRLVGRVAWRMLAANNRPMGRSAVVGTFDSPSFAFVIAAVSSSPTSAPSKPTPASVGSSGVGSGMQAGSPARVRRWDWRVWWLVPLRFAALAVVVTGAGVCSIPAVFASSSTSTVAVADHDKLNLFDCSHHKLSAAVVHPGECVVVVATGFASREPITVRQLSTRERSTAARANDGGVLSYRLTVAKIASMGPDVLTMVGLGGASRSTGIGLTPTGNLTATVPRFAVLHFKVTGGDADERRRSPHPA